MYLASWRHHGHLSIAGSSCGMWPRLAAGGVSRLAAGGKRNHRKPSSVAKQRRIVAASALGASASLGGVARHHHLGSRLWQRMAAAASHRRQRSVSIGGVAAAVAAGGWRWLASLHLCAVAWRKRSVAAWRHLGGISISWRSSKWLAACGGMAAWRRTSGVALSSWQKINGRHQPAGSRRHRRRHRREMRDGSAGSTWRASGIRR